MYLLLVLNDTGKNWKIVKTLEKSPYNLDTLSQLGATKYMHTKWKIVSVIYTEENFE